MRGRIKSFEILLFVGAFFLYFKLYSYLVLSIVLICFTAACLRDVFVSLFLLSKMAVWRLRLHQVRESILEDARHGHRQGSTGQQACPASGRHPPM